MKIKFSDSDDSLVRRLKNSDKKAFELIFQKYKGKLYYYAYSYLRSTAEAEEIIQIVFISLWENRHDLNEEYSLKNYIYKVTVNKIYNNLKHGIIKQKYADHLSRQTGEDNHSEESIMLNDFQDLLNIIIGELPPQQQTIYKLSRHNGLTNAEIANVLCISIRTVENQIYRALKFIKEKLRKESIISE